MPVIQFLHNYSLHVFIGNKGKQPYNHKSSKKFTTAVQNFTCRNVQHSAIPVQNSHHIASNKWSYRLGLGTVRASLSFLVSMTWTRERAWQMRSLGVGDPDIRRGPTGCRHFLSILYRPQSFGYSAGIKIKEERVRELFRLLNVRTKSWNSQSHKSNPGDWNSLVYGRAGMRHEQPLTGYIYFPVQKICRGTHLFSHLDVGAHAACTIHRKHQVQLLQSVCHDVWSNYNSKKSIKKQHPLNYISGSNILKIYIWMND